MHKKLPTTLAALTCLAMATPVLAQEGDKQLSFAQMFLWSDDVLGLVVIWTLLLMSAVTFGFAIKLFMDYRRGTMAPLEVNEQYEAMLGAKRYREAIEFAANDPSYLSKLISAGMNEASNGYGAMERAMEETADAETARYLRPVEYLNVIGNISPMLGLFGTVYGMIVAFYQLVQAEGNPDPAELAAGISTALVTTLWGLVVAMPSLLFYALIRNKIDALTAEGLIMAEELIRPFKPGGGSSRRSSSGGKPKPSATPTAPGPAAQAGGPPTPPPPR